MPDPMNEALLQHAAAWLAQREAQLLGEIAAGDAQSRSGDASDRDSVHDVKDDADRAQRASLNAAEVARDAEELAAVRAARRRLARGDYGACEDCGGPIGTARLQAQPAAARCAACQQRFESRSRAAPR